MSKIDNREDFPCGTRVAYDLVDGSKRPGTIVLNDDEYAARIEPDDKRDIVGLDTFVGWEFVHKL